MSGKKKLWVNPDPTITVGVRLPLSVLAARWQCHPSELRARLTPSELKTGIELPVESAVRALASAKRKVMKEVSGDV